MKAGLYSVALASQQSIYDVPPDLLVSLFQYYHEFFAVCPPTTEAYAMNGRRYAL